MAGRDRCRGCKQAPLARAIGELGAVPVSTIFDFAHRAGYHTAAYFSKSKLRQLAREGSLDEVRLPAGGSLRAPRTVPEAVRYLERDRPNLLFVHIAEPDDWVGEPVREAILGSAAAMTADSGGRP